MVIVCILQIFHRAICARDSYYSLQLYLTSLNHSIAFNYMNDHKVFKMVL